MKTTKKPCNYCNGTGFGFANEYPDTPFILQPVGCWNCEYCQGRGYRTFIYISENSVFDDDSDKLIQHESKDL